MPDGFLNEAEYISYPLVYPDVGEIPDCAIVDFGCMMFTGSGFRDGVDQVILDWIRRLDSKFEYAFSCTAPGLVGKQLRFSRDITDDRFTTSFSVAQLALTEVEADNTCPGGVGAPIIPPVPPALDDCPVNPLWTGFLVTGDLRRLTELLRACADASPLPTILKGPARVEPSRIQNLSEAYVRSIVVANKDRTRVTASAGCRPPVYNPTPDPYPIVGQCLDGEIRFASGYNMNVRQNNATNSIIFDGEPGSGLGYPCGEVPLYPGEIPAAGFDTLSGSVVCGDVIRSLNGIGGRNFVLSAGTGVVLTALPLSNRIILDFNMNSLALAPEIPPGIQVDCFEPTDPSLDPASCGPDQNGFDTFECPEPPPDPSGGGGGGTTTGPTTTGGPTTQPPVYPNVLMSDGFTLQANPYTGPSDGQGHVAAGFTGLGGPAAPRTWVNVGIGTPRTSGGTLKLQVPGNAQTKASLDMYIAEGMASAHVDDIYFYCYLNDKQASSGKDYRAYFRLFLWTSPTRDFAHSLEFATSEQLSKRYIGVNQVAVVSNPGFGNAVQGVFAVQKVGNVLKYKFGNYGVLSYTLPAAVSIYGVRLQASMQGNKNPLDMYELENVVVSQIKPTPGWPIG